MVRTTTLYYHPEIFYRMTNLYRKEVKIQNRMNKNFEFMLSQKLNEEKSEENGNKENKKFIDFLLDAKNNFSREEQRDHIKATIFAVKFLNFLIFLNCFFFH